jgi:hypothetical protein
MKYPSTYDADRIFLRNLVARDIAEPLPSFDHNTSAEEARAMLVEARQSVAGVRNKGWITGYIIVDELGPGTCGDYTHPLDEAVVLADSTPLFDLTRALKETEWVLAYWVITGIILS